MLRLVWDEDIGAEDVNDDDDDDEFIDMNEAPVFERGDAFDGVDAEEMDVVVCVSEEHDGLTPKNDTDLPGDLTPKAEAAGGGLEVSAEILGDFTLEDRVGEEEETGLAEAVVEAVVTSAEWDEDKLVLLLLLFLLLLLLGGCAEGPDEEEDDDEDVVKAAVVDDVVDEWGSLLLLLALFLTVFNRRCCHTGFTDRC